ncbi:MAG: alcohol dehydrogenase catalytic domain-containing protein [Chloroflexota bacterium]
MKALVLHEWGGPLKLEDVPVPKVGPGEALVKVRASGIGLTLNWIRQGLMGGKLPRIIGHEIAGDVVEVGPQVKSRKVGDRVCVYFYLNCGTCEFCRQNRETLCRNFGGVVGAAIDGGYAEYVKLPEENLLPIPDEMSYEDASIIPDAIGTPLHTVRERAQVRPPDTVMVMGAAGGVGIHAVQMAKLCGGWVIGVDTTDDKLAKTIEMGADAVINVFKKDFVEEAKRLTKGKGVDAVIDFVCTNDTLKKGFQSLNRGGRLVCLARGRAEPGVESALSVPPGALVGNEFIITGAKYCTKQELAETIEIVRQGRIKPIITQRFSMADVEKAHKLLDEGKIFGRAVMIM